MKQTTKRFISTVVGVMFLVGGLLLYLNFISPALDDIQDQKGIILGKESFIRTQKTAVTQVEALIKYYQAGEGQKLQDIVSEMLPLEEDIAGALAQVNGIVENSGLTLNSLGFAVSAPRLPAGRSGANSGATGLVKPLSTIKINAKISGSYVKFKELIKMIETNIRVFDIESVSLALPQDRKETAYTYSVILTTYFQKDVELGAPRSVTTQPETE